MTGADAETEVSVAEPDVAGAGAEIWLAGPDDDGTELSETDGGAAEAGCCACEGPEPGGLCTASDGGVEWPEEERTGGNQRVEEEEEAGDEEEEE